MPDFVIDNPTSVRFEVEHETRTIRGLALPYGDVAESGGKKWSFSKDTLTLGKAKVLDGHDWARAVGTAELQDTDDGLLMVAKIARGARGDEILALAEDGVYDGLSVGLANDVKATLKNGVYHATSGTVREVSLTPLPAFQRAVVTSVAASAVQQNREKNMPENETAEVETPVSLSAEDIGKAVSDGVTAAMTTFADTPRPVAAGRPLGFEVNEPTLYRFDGVQGAHDFSADLISGLGLGSRNPGSDPEAYERVLRFMDEALGPKFVTTTDTVAVNPSGYRSDMFVNEQQFATPLYNAFYKGALEDVTPFTFSKFVSGTGLVQDHVQGTEPTAGTYTTATAATVTPAPVSGKVHITREVADQGGNPQVSALIWNKIQYEYRKALETKVAALLAAALPAEFSSPALAAGAATVPTLAAPIESAIAGLNFIAGGNRYDYVAAHLDLYKALAALKDGDLRPYFPVLNPQNANGTVAAGYASLNVAGTRFDPVWSLGTVSDGTAHKSYLADRSSIWFWATAPKRLDRLQEKVEGYDLGVWGYWAGVISDITGLLKITYDPTP